MKTRIVEGRTVYLPLPGPNPALRSGPARFVPTPAPQYRVIALQQWALVVNGVRSLLPGAAVIDGDTVYHTADFPVDQWLEASNLPRGGA
jgi:hypothetical protein